MKGETSYQNLYIDLTGIFSTMVTIGSRLHSGLTSSWYVLHSHVLAKEPIV